MKPAPAGGSWAARHRRLLITAAIIVAVLVLVQVVASPIAEAVANRKLAALEGFTGRAGNVKLALWRGTIEIEDFVMHDREHPDDPPVVRIPKVMLSGAARPFLSGRLGGEALIENAEFTIVKRQRFDGPLDALEEAKEEVREQQAAAKRWENALKDAMPMEMKRIELRNAKIRFLDRTHQPEVDVAIEQLNVVATGLRNQPDPNETPLEIRMDGRTTGDGQMKLYVRADPLANPVELFTTFEIKDLKLPPCNAMLLAYTDTDVSSGVFDIYVEANVANRAYDGYIKPFFTNLEFETASDENKGVVNRVKEAAVGLVTKVLENDNTQKVATQTPFRGQLADNEIGIWPTVENLLSNAFVRALREGFGRPQPES